jgi:hypothetical protein
MECDIDVSTAAAGDGWKVATGESDGSLGGNGGFVFDATVGEFDAVFDVE